MARRGITTNRLIAMLGIAALALGVLVLWRVVDTGGIEFVDESPGVRAARQARELLGPEAEIQLLHVGSGRVVCGYVGEGRGQPSQPFLSRPNRMMLSTDPLGAEFKDTLARECAGFPTGPRVTPVP